MTTVTIQGRDYKNDTFIVTGINDLSGFDLLKCEMKKHGYEPRHYILTRIVEGTRKQKYDVVCMYEGY